MWLITERGIGAFLILLSSLGRGSVLTHNTACHHPATLHLRWLRVTCGPSITSRTRVQAFKKVTSISVLQQGHRDRRCRQDDKESKNEWDSASHGVHTLPDLRMQHFSWHCKVVNLVVLHASTPSATAHEAESLEQYVAVCTHDYTPWKCMNHFVQCLKLKHFSQREMLPAAV